MDVRLSDIWKRAAETIAADPSTWPELPADFAHSDLAATLRDRRRRKQLDEHAAEELKREHEQARLQSRERKEAELQLMIAQDPAAIHRQLARNIESTRRFVLEAYNEAVLQQEQARKDFEDLRGRAITLPDGRRVYFTQDGSALYDENEQRVTDADLVAYAQAQRDGEPDVPMYEAYLRTRDAYRKADGRVEHLSGTLTRLEDLRERLERAEPEDLAGIHEELDTLVDELPEPLRSRALDARIAYRGADMDAMLSRPSNNVLDGGRQPSPDQPSTQPALLYKSAPPF